MTEIDLIFDDWSKRYPLPGDVVRLRAGKLMTSLSDSSFKDFPGGTLVRVAHPPQFFQKSARVVRTLDGTHQTRIHLLDLDLRSPLECLAEVAE